MSRDGTSWTVTVGLPGVQPARRGRVSAMTTWFEKYMDAAQDPMGARMQGWSNDAVNMPRSEYIAAEVEAVTVAAFEADVTLQPDELAAAAAYFGGEYDEVKAASATTYGVAEWLGLWPNADLSQVEEMVAASDEVVLADYVEMFENVYAPEVPDAVMLPADPAELRAALAAEWAIGGE